MRKLFFLTIVCLFLAVPGAYAGDESSISYGTSFGECAGYCYMEVVVTPQKIIYHQTSHEEAKAQFPDKKYEKPITSEQWEEFSKLVDVKVISGLSDVYGCPDCADGGAEWIEVEMKDFHKKSAFDYGKEMPEISPLLNKLRLLSSELEQEFNKPVK